MKRINLFLFVLLALCYTVVAQQTKKPFVLKGHISGIQTGWMHLYYTNSKGERQMDSAALAAGKFTFSGELSYPTMAYLSLKEEKRTQNNSVGFFLEPSVMTAELVLNQFAKATFTGSETQNEYAALHSKKQRIQDRWQVVMDTLSAVNKRSNVEYQELKDWVLQPYTAEMRALDLTFFEQHPASYVTANMMRYYVSSLSLDSLQMYYKRLGTTLQLTPDGKDLANEIQKLREGSPGSMAKNFAATDINGNKLTLGDFKGKYVLLDFWASWCVPCRKGNPHLKALYARYKSKGIEFIGVSDDDRNHEAWKKAVEKDGLSWRHVLRGLDMEKRMKNEPNDADISEKFGIHTLPTKILIDPSGKIIGRYGEEEAMLDAQLWAIFGT